MTTITDREPYNIIIKDGIKYKFTWSSVGWSYAQINIYVIKIILGIKFLWPIYSNSTSISGYSLGAKQMEEMLPDDFKRQCQYTLDKYLTHKKAWENAREKNDND